MFITRILDDECDDIEPSQERKEGGKNFCCLQPGDWPSPGAQTWPQHTWCYPAISTGFPIIFSMAFLLLLSHLFSAAVEVGPALLPLISHIYCVALATPIKCEIRCRGDGRPIDFKFINNGFELVHFHPSQL